MTLQFDISAHAVAVREARAAGKGLCAFVIDGEACCESCVGSCACPPERFRAVAKCETCGGSGRVANIIGWNELTAIIDGKRPCPNCVGGVPVVELTAECPSNDCENGWLWDDRSIPHAPYDGSGRVSLGRATVSVLPVVANPDDGWSCRCDFVAVVEGRVRLYQYAASPNGSRHAWQASSLDVNPPPSPGQFVVVVEFKDEP